MCIILNKNQFKDFNNKSYKECIFLEANADSDSNIGVQCRYITILYLAFIVRNLFLKNSEK